MKTMTRRDLCVALPALAAIGADALQAVAMQVHASEYPAPQAPPPPARTVPSKDVPAAPTPPATANLLSASRAFAFDQMPARTMANGGESRDIVHGSLATGETVSLHQSMQVVGAVPNPLHVIQHSEFILVREGSLEFEHEGAEAQIVSETVGPGGAIYVAFGTRHTVKNVGNVAARYFVIAIGGDAK